MTTQFRDESAWDAIVNDNSLDIVEEDAFLRFCEAQGIAWDLTSLSKTYLQWNESRGGFITVRPCVDCGCSVGGGPTRCDDCVSKLER